VITILVVPRFPIDVNVKSGMLLRKVWTTILVVPRFPIDVIAKSGMLLRKVCIVYISLLSQDHVVFCVVSLLRSHRPHVCYSVFVQTDMCLACSFVS